MKKIFIYTASILFIALFVGCSSSYNTKPSNSIGLSDPQTYRFEFSYQPFLDVSTVVLAGDFNGWDPINMEKGADGVWRTTLSLLPETYGYKFIVNGHQWVHDPKATGVKYNDGSENSAVTILEGSDPRALYSHTGEMVHDGYGMWNALWRETRAFYKIGDFSAIEESVKFYNQKGDMPDGTRCSV